MKTKIQTLLLLSLISFQPCKAQEIQTALPKIENYTKGELEIMVETFGSETPIAIGKVTADGTIHFNFPNLDLNAMDETYFFSMKKIGRAVGMFICHDKEIKENTETVEAIEIKDVFLYKYGKPVGALLTATQKEMLEDKFVVGSTISWFYSREKGMLKATCTTYEEDDLGNGGLDKNNVRNTTSYDISFKKGWNIVEHKLLETKEIKKGEQAFSRRLIEQKTSVTNIPVTINWYLKYWANDELLEIEHQLAKQVPITKEQYENWLPKKLGNLKRTAYEIGKKLERMPTLNNIELLFEKGDKKATVTIVDCAQNKEAVSVYTLILDMASKDWKDKTETGYRSATKMDNTSMMIEYNEKEAKTTLSYNAKGRFIIKAEAINIKPEELWALLKALQIEKLIKH